MVNISSIITNRSHLVDAVDAKLNSIQCNIHFVGILCRIILFLGINEKVISLVGYQTARML